MYKKVILSFIWLASIAALNATPNTNDWRKEVTETTEDLLLIRKLNQKLRVERKRKRQQDKREERSRKLHALTGAMHHAHDA